MLQIIIWPIEHSWEITHWVELPDTEDKHQQAGIWLVCKYSYHKYGIHYAHCSCLFAHAYSCVISFPLQPYEYMSTNILCVYTHRHVHICMYMCVCIYKCDYVCACISFKVHLTSWVQWHMLVLRARITWEAEAERLWVLGHSGLHS